MTATATPPAVSYGVTLANDGSFSRTEWREIGIPTSIARQLTGDGSAIALRTDDAPPKLITCHPGRRFEDVWFFWAHVHVPARSVLHWHLAKVDPVADGQPGQDVAAPYVSDESREVRMASEAARLHPYVGDDVRELLTSFEVVDDNGVLHTLHPADMVFTVRELARHRNVYTLRGFVPGTPLHVKVNAYAYDLQAHVRLEVFVGLGGVTIGNGVVSYRVRSIVMKCGEAISIQHKQRCGVTDTTRDRNGDWNTLLSGPRSIGRAEELPFFGWMLCLPSMEVTAPDAVQVERNYQGILLGGTCAATFENWDGHFGALRQVPVLPRSHTGWPAANLANAAHKAAQTQRGDLYDQRPMGLAKYAGQTGSQEDFGAGQDLLALRVADPRRQDELQFSAHGFFLRPFHNRDDSARPIMFRDHQACRTWSQVPERRVGSGDSLGWPPNLPNSWGNSGYSKIDDQHRSQELITCWGHLVDSFAVTDLLVDFVQMDLGQAMVYQDRVEAPRAEGRCLAAWADMLGLLPFVTLVPSQEPGALAAASTLKELLDHGTRRLNILDRTWVGRGLPDGRVRPLLLGTSPAIQANAVPVVVVWEHAIAAMGLYAWWKRTGNDVAYRLCRHTCEMIMQFGIFERDGSWSIALGLMWQQDGVPLPAGDYRPGSPTVDVGGGDWWTWVLPAVLILAHEWPDSPHAAKARACLSRIYRDGPSTEVEAEWWAVVPHRNWAGVDEPETTDEETSPPAAAAAPQGETTVVDESKPIDTQSSPPAEPVTAVASELVEDEPLVIDPAPRADVAAPAGEPVQPATDAVAQPTPTE